MKNNDFKFPTKKAFLSWLEKRKSREEFDFMNTYDCLFARFLMDNGCRKVNMGVENLNIGCEIFQCPVWMVKISQRLERIVESRDSSIMKMREVKKLILKN